MSIDKVQPDTLIEQAALSQLREQAPVENGRVGDTLLDHGVVSDEGAQATLAGALTDAVIANTGSTPALDAGDQLIASDAWQGATGEARTLLDATPSLAPLGSDPALDDSRSLAQALDAAVGFVLNPVD